MEKMLTPQEMFNTQMSLGAINNSILGRFNIVWEKHLASLALGILSADYYRDVQAIAEDHNLKYTPPVGIGVLKGVGNPATLH